ncbi:MAG TPA: DUF3943 domain-containing protein [Aggregicoccus sp.]|nr:DUF3943 domain-containing protein [Aggregicoccus sp.]
MAFLLCLLLAASGPLPSADSPGPAPADADPALTPRAAGDAPRAAGDAPRAAPLATRGPVAGPPPAAIPRGPALAPGALPADAPLRAAAPPPGLSEEQPRWTVPVLHSVGVVLGMRAGLSALWPRAYDPSRLREGVRQLGAAYTRPPEFHRGVPLLESDGDPWLLNTVGHGLFGSEVYGRARHCGHSALASLAGAAVASTAWEYSLEALHQRPSALDLVWTPLAGALLGEGRFRLHRLVRGHGERVGPLRRALLVALDPLGEAERGLLGTDC